MRLDFRRRRVALSVELREPCLHLAWVAPVYGWGLLAVAVLPSGFHTHAELAAPAGRFQRYPQVDGRVRGCPNHLGVVVLAAIPCVGVVRPTVGRPVDIDYALTEQRRGQAALIAHRETPVIRRRKCIRATECGRHFARPAHVTRGRRDGLHLALLDWAAPMEVHHRSELRRSFVQGHRHRARVHRARVASELSRRTSHVEHLPDGTLWRIRFGASLEDVAERQAALAQALVYGLVVIEDRTLELRLGNRCAR
mmetsp:Transcript_11150/g.46422  ORF Transcript_11150/g.46422 Transcript_11150/m.46422 type:complete len:253 (+) Transcript_11150:228-986(+)